MLLSILETSNPSFAFSRNLRNFSVEELFVPDLISTSNRAHSFTLVALVQEECEQKCLYAFVGAGKNPLGIYAIFERAFQGNLHFQG